jgi:hypothetical protein
MSRFLSELQRQDNRYHGNDCPGMKVCQRHRPAFRWKYLSPQFDHQSSYTTHNFFLGPGLPGWSLQPSNVQSYKEDFG